MSGPSTSRAALLGIALLAGGCVNDLGVGLSRISPDDQSPDDQSPDDDAPTETDSGATGSDAGAGGDASFDAGPRGDAGSDASAPRDAQAALDAATGDAGSRPRDASASDAMRADACAQSGARCEGRDAGAPEPCLDWECTAVLFTPALSSEECESGSMECRRDDAGICGYYCVPPFIAQDGEDTVISLLGDAAARDTAARDGGARQGDTEAQSDAAGDAAGPSEPAEGNAAASSDGG